MSSFSRLSRPSRIRSGVLPAWPPPAVNLLVALTMAMWAVQSVLIVWEPVAGTGALRPAGDALLALLGGADAPGVLERTGALSWEALRTGRWWTPLTHLFLHDGLLHAGGNALVLWFAGRPVEAILGRRAFLGLWLAGLAVAPAGAHLQGGSAAAAAVLFAMVTMLPELDLRTIVPGLGRLPVAVRARHFGWGCLAAWLAPLLLTGDPAHAAAQRSAALAHAAGAVAGWTGARLLGFGRQRPAPVPLMRPAFAGPPARRKEAAAVAAVPPPVARVEAAEVENPSEFVRAVADPILEKLARGGWSALTPQERALLDEASRRLRDQSR